MATQLRIGQVARRAGVSVEAIRYYERLGLVPTASRTPSGYRQFAPDAVERIRFVQRAQGLGFSLAEIRELLELRASPEASAADVRDRTGAKLRNVEAKIADLVRMRDALRTLLDRCHGEGPTGECPILEALEGDPAAPEASQGTPEARR